MVGVTAIETATNGIVNITILITEIMWCLIMFRREIEFIPPQVDVGDQDSVVAVSVCIAVSLSCRGVCAIWMFLWMCLEIHAVTCV
jgi:hypothetical protein